MNWLHKQALWAQLILFAVFLTGCAAWDRSCSSWYAGAVGADWVVVKNDLNGKPFRCWMLEDVSMSNEGGSDGIYWKGLDGNLVHISGNYDYVQVHNQGGDPYTNHEQQDPWEGALSELGLTKAGCAKLRNRNWDPK